jgi:hypothetical protein
MTFTGAFRKYAGWCPNARALPASQRGMREMGDTGAGSPGDIPAGGVTGWIGRNGQTSVAITAGFCLITLTVVLKNVLLVPAEILNQDIVLYIIIYCGFFTAFTPVKDQVCPDKPERWPLFWCALIVIATLGIIVVYAL